MKNLTKLESQVLRTISFGDEFDETPAECFLTIMDDFEGTKNQLKGVLSSLLKKDLIWLGEYPNGMTSYHLND